MYLSPCGCFLYSLFDFFFKPPPEYEIAMNLASAGSGGKGARASRMLTHRQLHAGMMVMMSLVKFISACLRGSHKRMLSL